MEIVHGREQGIFAVVVADYQDQLERDWVAELRRRYTFTVDENVLRQVKSTLRQ